MIAHAFPRRRRASRIFLGAMVRTSGLLFTSLGALADAPDVEAQIESASPVAVIRRTPVASTRLGPPWRIQEAAVDTMGICSHGEELRNIARNLLKKFHVKMGPNAVSTIRP